ncbi:uncharacterized protein [Miscanthus floridulus]|uniref:uncharacterized protein n=1 Tax=Miscanthus floridulus TaxID=154761 RepID=UPI00345A5D06
MYLLQIQYFSNVFISEQSNYAWTSHCPVTRTDLASVVRFRQTTFYYQWTYCSPETDFTRKSGRNRELLFLWGYFILLLKSIEANLRAWNISLLAAPVDPEMVQIWSEKLGFTVLSAEEKESVLESHPLVMFKNLVLVQKSLA